MEERTILYLSNTSAESSQVSKCLPTRRDWSTSECVLECVAQHKHRVTSRVFHMTHIVVVLHRSPTVIEVIDA